MLIVFVIIFGLIIGSFLTACIHRIPRSQDYAEMHHELGNESFEPVTLLNPRRSFCPSCKNQIPAYCNIPVFSWLFLRGRCLFCKAEIPSRYVVVELLAGLGALLSYTEFGLTPTGFLVYAFFCALLIISFIDLDFFIIPNVISLPGILIGVVFSFLNQIFEIFYWPLVPDLAQSLLGILVGGGFLFLVAEVYLRLRNIEGLGMGDVKLLAMTGAFFGPYCAGYTIFLGSLIGSICGISMIVFGAKKMSQHIPFGPYLSLGTFLYLYFPDEVLSSTQFVVTSVAQLIHS